jgi:hypothetical protein
MAWDAAARSTTRILKGNPTVWRNMGLREYIDYAGLGHLISRQVSLMLIIKDNPPALPVRIHQALPFRREEII